MQDLKRATGYRWRYSHSPLPARQRLRVANDERWGDTARGATEANAISERPELSSRLFSHLPPTICYVRYSR